MQKEHAIESIMSCHIFVGMHVKFFKGQKQCGVPEFPKKVIRVVSTKLITHPKTNVEPENLVKGETSAKTTNFWLPAISFRGLPQLTG